MEKATGNEFISFGPPTEGANESAGVFFDVTNRGKRGKFIPPLDRMNRMNSCRKELCNEKGDRTFAAAENTRNSQRGKGGDAGKMSKIITPASAKLAIAGQELTVKTSPTEQEAVFRVTLKEGPTLMQAWFQDAQGEDVCGAFFAYVVRKER